MSDTARRDNSGWIAFKPIVQGEDVDMAAARVAENEQNYAAFQAVVGTLIPDHEGGYALLHHGKVVEVYNALIDAVVAGHSQFTDGMFSIQEVTVVPLDLGFFSHADPDGPLC